MSPTPRQRGTLELRGISKRFVAGAGSCTACVTALRSASIEVRSGEVLIVAGPRGSGKTTLLLCAAGLLRCDGGTIFGDARRVVYRNLIQPARAVPLMTGSAVLFLDSCDDLGELARHRASRMVGEALAAGAAVVLAARDANSCFQLVPASATVAVVHLRLGETSGAHLGAAAVNRVAEPAGSGY